MVVKITNAEFSEKVASGVSVVDFNATWCGPCKMLAPILEEVSEEMTEINFYAVDVDECPELARTYRIASIPAVAVIKDGELQGMSVGLVPADELKSFIEQHK